jgi:hypothetical protein
MANFPLIYEGQHRKRKKWEGDTRWCHNHHQSIYCSLDLVDLGRFFSFLIHIQSVRPLGWGSGRCRAATYTEQHQHRINAHRYPCLEWDSKPRSQCSSRRRQFIPYIARPLWLAHKHHNRKKIRRYIGGQKKTGNKAFSKVSL